MWRPRVHGVLCSVVPTRGARGEGMLSDDLDRDHVSEAELALDRDGHFLALRARNISNIGAYLAPGGIISPTMHLRRQSRKPARNRRRGFR